MTNNTYQKLQPLIAKWGWTARKMHWKQKSPKTQEDDGEEDEFLA